LQDPPSPFVRKGKRIIWISGRSASSFLKTDYPGNIFGRNVEKPSVPAVILPSSMIIRDGEFGVKDVRKRLATSGGPGFHLDGLKAMIAGDGTMKMMREDAIQARKLLQTNMME
jgi:hypothetical protein